MSISSSCSTRCRYKGVKFTFQAKELEAAPGRFTEYSPARPAGRFSEDSTTQLAGRFSEDSTVQKAGKEIESTTVRLDIMERKWVDSNHEKVQRIFTEENVKAEMNDRGYVMSGEEFSPNFSTSQRDRMNRNDIE